MKVGEKRLNMLKCFNYREGVSPDLDCLPNRIFQPLAEGPKKGARVDQDAFHSAVKDFYAIRGWDYHSGRPTRGKLLELGLTWLNDMLD